MCMCVFFVLFKIYSVFFYLIQTERNYCCTFKMLKLLFSKVNSIVKKLQTFSNDKWSIIKSNGFFLVFFNKEDTV